MSLNRAGGVLGGTAVAAGLIVAGCGGAPSLLPADAFCLATIDGSHSQGPLNVGIYESDPTPLVWPTGIQQTTVGRWVACGKHGTGQRLAHPDSLDGLSITFQPEPSPTAWVVGISPDPDFWWKNSSVLTLWAGAPGDTIMTVRGQFEGVTAEGSRAIHVREIADLRLRTANDQPPPWPAPGQPPATPSLEGSLWDLGSGAPMSADGEEMSDPNTFGVGLPLPWTRADGRLQVLQAGSPARTFYRFLGPGTTTVHFADGDAGAIGLATVEVVPPSSITEAALLDQVGGPLRDASCSPGETIVAQVSLKDAAGRSIAGGGALVRSLDLQVARVRPNGVVALIDCISGGRTTIEVVTAGRVSASLGVRP